MRVLFYAPFSDMFVATRDMDRTLITIVRRAVHALGRNDVRIEWHWGGPNDPMEEVEVRLGSMVMRFSREKGWYSASFSRVGDLLYWFDSATVYEYLGEPGRQLTADGPVEFARELHRFLTIDLTRFVPLFEIEVYPEVSEALRALQEAANREYRRSYRDMAEAARAARAMRVASLRWQIRTGALIGLGASVVHGVAVVTRDLIEHGARFSPNAMGYPVEAARDIVVGVGIGTVMGVILPRLAVMRDAAMLSFLVAVALCAPHWSPLRPSATWIYCVLFGLALSVVGSSYWRYVVPAARSTGRDGRPGRIGARDRTAVDEADVA